MRPAIRDMGHLTCRHQCQIPHLCGQHWVQAVSEQFEASVTAVDSGIRRMVDQLEARPGPAWLAFKADTGLGSGKPTTGKLIYAVRSAVLRQKTDK